MGISLFSYSVEYLPPTSAIVRYFCVVPQSVQAGTEKQPGSCTELFLTNPFYSSSY
jgi:hypothetical protein